MLKSDFFDKTSSDARYTEPAREIDGVRARPCIVHVYTNPLLYNREHATCVTTYPREKKAGANEVVRKISVIRASADIGDCRIMQRLHHVKPSGCAYLDRNVEFCRSLRETVHPHGGASGRGVKCSNIVDKPLHEINLLTLHCCCSDPFLEQRAVKCQRRWSHRNSAWRTKQIHLNSLRRGNPGKGRREVVCIDVL